MPVLVEVGEGVLVRQSQFCQSNAIVVIGCDGVLLIDPGVDGHDLRALSDDLVRLGLSVAAGFATHPHWDHLLWHAEFGAVPQYATEKCVVTARAHALDARTKAQRLAPGAPVELIGHLTPLPAGTALVPWDGPDVQIIEHDAHAPGHAALVIANADVVVAGDMLSDVEIPLLDLRSGSRDPLGDYEIGLGRIAASLNNPDVTLIPGTEASPTAAKQTREPSPTRTTSRIFDRVGPRPIHDLVPPRHMDPTGCHAIMSYSVMLSDREPLRNGVEDSTGKPAHRA